MLRERAQAMLEEQILPFWKSLRDDEFGGYYGQVNFDRSIDRRAVKGCILHSRILWFFSRCAKALNRRDYLEEAEHAYRFLRDRFLDREFGGTYWSVDFRGEPQDDGKHTYCQAFAVYGLSAYYEASGDAEALRLATELFHLIEGKCRDTGGYLEAFDRRFAPVENEKLSENGVMAGRTMNTLLHVFEGCAGLYQAKPDSDVGAAMREILAIFQEKVYNPNLRRQEVFFDRDYHSLIDLHSYGHDIETSWLLDWGCGLLGDAELSARISALGSALAESVYDRAFRGRSVRNECERGRVDETRVWWVQAEAVLGFVNEWEKRPEDEKFLRAAGDVLDFIQRFQADHRSGSEWFWAVGPDGEPDSSQPLAGMWKCPYHNGRMCLELIRRNPHA